MTNKTGFKETEIGLIPEDWEVKRIGELVKINESNIGKSFEYDTIEYIDIASVDKGRITDINKIKLEDAPSRAKRIVKDNDILISTVRPNLRHYTFIEKSKPNTIASTGFAVISGKKINPRFLYYYLTTNYYTDYLTSIADSHTSDYLTSIADSHTSAYPSFNPDVIENSFIPYPSELEQEAIANILFSLDKKIELNHKMNQTLEKIGQAIFKHWFIDFEFPDEEGKPYKSNGCEMVDSKLGEIPKGWETVENIAEICELTNYGYTQSASEEKVGPKFLRVMDINKGDWINWSSVPHCEIEEKNLPKYILEKRDIVIARMADPGKVAIFESNIDAVFASYLIRIRLKDRKLSYYIYYLMKSNYYQHYILGASSGTVQRNLNAKGLTTGLSIVIPNENAINKFNESIMTLRDKINNDIKENENLSQIRDSLLPKLMSGKIRVKGDTK
jgi:type I restriction enzyme S subunit